MSSKQTPRLCAFQIGILFPFDTTLAFQRPDEMMAYDVKGTPKIPPWHLRSCELASLSMVGNGSSGDGNFHALAWGLPGYPGFSEILDVEV